MVDVAPIEGTRGRAMPVVVQKASLLPLLLSFTAGYVDTAGSHNKVNKGILPWAS